MPPHDYLEMIMNELLLRPVAKPDSNKLSDAYEVASDIVTKVGFDTVRVPKFFQYDGASIPSLGWQIIGSPFHPRFMVAAVFHDWLYHTHQIKREAADELFYTLLLSFNVQQTKAVLMREAVKNFGGWYWDNDPDDLAYIARLAKKIQDDGRKPSDYGISAA
jgi:hypothetical protein